MHEIAHCIETQRGRGLDASRMREWLACDNTLQHGEDATTRISRDSLSCCSFRIRTHDLESFFTTSED